MTANIDPETWIRYGVMSQNTQMPEAINDLFCNTIDIQFEEAETEIDEAIDELMAATHDYHGGDQSLRDQVKNLFMERMENFEGDMFRYEDDEYTIIFFNEMNTVMVMRSPYYTKCRPCSPCYPNAGDLDSPDVGGEDTYCLGWDFFNDGHYPYVISEVKDHGA